MNPSVSRNVRIATCTIGISTTDTDMGAFDIGGDVHRRLGVHVTSSLIHDGGVLIVTVCFEWWLMVAHTSSTKGGLNPMTFCSVH